MRRHLLRCRPGLPQAGGGGPLHDCIAMADGTSVPTSLPRAGAARELGRLAAQEPADGACAAALAVALMYQGDLASAVAGMEAAFVRDPEAMLQVGSQAGGRAGCLDPERQPVQSMLCTHATRICVPRLWAPLPLCRSPQSPRSSSHQQHLSNTCYPAL